MAAATPPARRRALWVALGVVAVLLVLGLSAALIVVLVRPAPASAAPAPAATPGSTPEPGPAGTTPTTADPQQHQQYRAYVSTVVKGGTSVMAGMIGLSGCRVSRQECLNRMGDASGQVGGLRHDLAATPAPPCLTAADQRLQDALSFQQTGLDTARDAVRAHDRVRLVQGLLLAGAGLWRGGQAVVAGRESKC
jgi:hypothetical protein